MRACAGWGPWLCWAGEVCFGRGAACREAGMSDASLCPSSKINHEVFHGLDQSENLIILQAGNSVGPVISATGYSLAASIMGLSEIQANTLMMSMLLHPCYDKVALWRKIFDSKCMTSGMYEWQRRVSAWSLTSRNLSCCLELSNPPAIHHLDAALLSPAGTGKSPLCTVHTS